MEVLGIKPESSERVATALNCSAVSISNKDLERLVKPVTDETTKFEIKFDLTIYS